MGVAATVDSQNLPRHIGGVEQQETNGSGNVRGMALALEQGAGDDGFALGGRKLIVVGPFDCAGRDAVDAHVWRQLHRQRACQAEQAGFGRTVQRIAAQRTLGMDVEDIDDRTVACSQFRRERLRQKQRAAQVGADQRIPGRVVNVADGGGEKIRSIVYQTIETPEGGVSGRCHTFGDAVGGEVAGDRYG